MKHFSLIILILMLTITVLSCSNGADVYYGDSDATFDSSDTVHNPGSNTSTDSSADSTTPALTGYPDGQVQRMFVFVNGTLYVSADEAPRSDLPAGFVEIGQVSVNDVHNVPAEELHAAHIEVGSAVYAADGEDAVYVAETSGKFRKYVICTNGEIWQP